LGNISCEKEENTLSKSDSFQQHRACGFQWVVLMYPDVHREDGS
jgi:hypothetical protein